METEKQNDLQINSNNLPTADSAKNGNAGKGLKGRSQLVGVICLIGAGMISGTISSFFLPLFWVFDKSGQLIVIASFILPIAITVVILLFVGYFLSKRGTIIASYYVLGIFWPLIILFLVVGSCFGVISGLNF